MANILKLTQIRRFIVIVWVFCRFRLDAFLPKEALHPGVRLILLLAPWHFFPTPKQSKAQRLKAALERLGPIFIKFGQILSTRRDLLPDELADELKRLQDEVKPFDANESKQRIEKGLGKPVAETFAHFDDKVLASASIAQVHAATLLNGQAVVVKVIRPYIEKTIVQDISLMLLFARAIERFWADGKRLHPVQVVVDYERTIFDELDLQREAANASQLRRNFSDSELIYIPEVYWDFCSKNVMVMERIYGIPIADIEALKEANIDMKRLAERGVEIFFTQVFRDSFFHADMHPGNIFVSPSNPSSPQYIAIDFGIVGTLSQDDQSYLARNLLAFFNRDYKQVAELHISSGWIPKNTRVDEFESAIRTVCEPIFEKPLSEISFGHFLLRLFQTARRFNMEVQPQLVLLQKTLLNIEGLGRQLYPELDLWNTAHPYLENWMKQRVAPPGVFKQLRQRLPDIIEQSPEIPKLVYDAMTRIRDLDQVQATRNEHLNSLIGNNSSHNHSASKRAIGLSLIALAALISQPELLVWLKSQPMFSIASAALGAWLLLK